MKLSVVHFPHNGSNGAAVVAFTVNLSTDMGGTGYTTAAILNGAVALLTNLAITATSIINSHQISVTVHNNGLIASSPVQVLAMAI